MEKTTILQTKDPFLNASLLITIITPIFMRDYKLQEDGLHCFFTQSIFHYRVLIKTFLAALYEITSKQFYFEIISHHEAVLKLYAADQLQFSKDLLFKTIVSPEKDSL